jgi:hypothetical protein
LYQFFNEKVPDLSAHLKSLDYDPALLGFQWLVTVFSSTFPDQTLLPIWDLFFLKGVQVIFKAILSMFLAMKRDLLQTDDFGNSTSFNLF